MNIVISTNTGLWRLLRRPFVSKPYIRKAVVTKERACEPLGIARTVFEDNYVHYFEPIQPWQTMGTEECLKRFGRKTPAHFKQLTTAAINTFKS